MKIKWFAIFLTVILFVGCLGGCGTNNNDSPATSSNRATVTTEEMVWVPTHGGTKYHKINTCSNMIDPNQVSLRQAVREGFSPCKWCYG
ncbi:MAG: hypothetical protein IKA50_00190 [Clostridia bacterium]|nr:hypothetical protein [Clostridia bacterium]